MKGTIVYRPQRNHKCDTPGEYWYKTPGDGRRVDWDSAYKGMVWQCDCGRLWKHTGYWWKHEGRIARWWRKRKQRQENR